jgi:hypothetical protein
VEAESQTTLEDLLGDDVSTGSVEE